MSFPTITVYGNSDNETKIRVYTDEFPLYIGKITKFIIELDNKKELDSIKHPNMFVVHEQRGVLGLRLGTVWWATNVYYGKLLLFDDYYWRGLNCGTMRIIAQENPVSQPYPDI